MKALRLNFSNLRTWSMVKSRRAFQNEALIQPKSELRAEVYRAAGPPAGAGLNNL